MMVPMDYSQVVSVFFTILCHLSLTNAEYYNWYRRRPQIIRPQLAPRPQIVQRAQIAQLPQIVHHHPGFTSTFQPFMNMNDMCSIHNPSDVLRMLPGRFMSEDDLLNIVPEPTVMSSVHKPRYTALRRVIVGSFSSNSPFKSGQVDYTNDGLCGCCLTEIGYEVIETVTDFRGRNHTLINFNNNYQFIPTGRCSNEDAPCGGGGRARCKQVTRAHWSLVWTPRVGVQLVAHEVPSHCQCLNLGSVATRTTIP